MSSRVFAFSTPAVSKRGRLFEEGQKEVSIFLKESLKKERLAFERLNIEVCKNIFF